jgi:hypothetical protein
MVFSYLSYNFFTTGDIVNAITNGFISLFFLGFMIWNISKNREKKEVTNDRT